MTDNMRSLRRALLKQRVREFKEKYNPKEWKKRKSFVYKWAEGNGYSVAEIGEAMA